MKITGIFIFIIVGVVIFSSVTKSDASPRRIKRGFCPKFCGNQCEFFVEKGRSCTEKNGKYSLTCDPGYEFPRGGKSDHCYPVAWRCFINNKNPDKRVMCNRTFAAKTEI